MERILANAMVWYCYYPWAEEYYAALDEEMQPEDETSSLMRDLAVNMLSRDKTWDIFAAYVLPIVDVYDVSLFKRELVRVLETIYRSDGMTLESFSGIAYAVSLLLDEYGIEDGDVLEFACGDALMEDKGADACRKAFEDVFRRYGYDY